MTAILLAAAAAASSLPGLSDPAPGLWHTKTRSRNLVCERVSTQTGSRQYPGQIVTSGPRGDYIERRAVICREPLARPDLRSPRDEAILSSLDATADDLAGSAESMRPDLQDRVWLVQAYYPSAVMAAKISFATKNALVHRGLSVSDRAPTLAAGDIEILTRMAPDEAYPAACRRYFQSGSLREGDALFAVISRDRRETILHAGLCVRGQWMWLK